MPHETHDTRGAALTVYSPESSLRTPGVLARDMAESVLGSRELAWQLMVRDLRARYRQSFLGVVWAIVPPLVSTGLFVWLNEAGVVQMNQSSVPYPVFCLLGIVLWQLFVEGLNSPLGMVTENRSMLRKINFRREALLLAGAGKVLFDFGIRSLVLIPFFFIYDLPVTWGLALAPVAIFMLLLLGLVLGILLVPLGVLYNDVSKAVSAATGLLMFLTPVIYAAPKGGILGWVVLLNPVSALLGGSRDLITTGVVLQPTAFLLVSGVTLSMGGFVWVIYRVSFPILIERLGS
jgi:homopolymeric O-antigen transport system permease protein